MKEKGKEEREKGFFSYGLLPSGAKNVKNTSVGYKAFTMSWIKEI